MQFVGDCVQNGYIEFPILLAVTTLLNSNVNSTMKRRMENKLYFILLGALLYNGKLTANCIIMFFASILNSKSSSIMDIGGVRLLLFLYG